MLRDIVKFLAVDELAELPRPPAGYSLRLFEYIDRLPASPEPTGIKDHL